ncbi:MAG: twin-arginine translocase TatA/TatE family subunit [Planctomycetes bacterium]|nr:twin-arginine translocase TatA/TatE family subunit [Planctomycetota bacterium]
MLGPWEILLILFAVLILFGHRLPAVSRSLGRSFSEFKKGLHDAGENGIDSNHRDTRV